MFGQRPFNQCAYNENSNIVRATEEIRPTAAEVIQQEVAVAGYDELYLGSVTQTTHCYVFDKTFFTFFFMQPALEKCSGLDPPATSPKEVMIDAN